MGAPMDGLSAGQAMLAGYGLVADRLTELGEPELCRLVRTLEQGHREQIESTHQARRLALEAAAEIPGAVREALQEALQKVK
ncbi:hypothetical protein [Nocardia transvalensis]|uniref:hypothetical protein n=1 Tax=Nocardia transvalensis TaxID=37333 RepID=UPI001895CF4A|nr:hypothetical protein [Nocardia transvalensis]MBF6333609.1 hypothetical protein [Nocardia transvalensis]